MDRFEKIRGAVEKRDAFLTENPQYKPLQDEIDELLKKTGPDLYKRQAVLQQLLLNTWYKIVPAWGSFHEN